MINLFICGSSSFHHQAEEDDEYISPWSSPRKPRKLSSLCRNKDAKNPYADRGLDKFSALLADIEGKRQKIYTQMGAEGISFVRFVYSNANDCKPIVVRAREKQQEKNNADSDKDKPVTQNLAVMGDSSTPPNEIQQPRTELGDDKTQKKISCYSWNLMKMETWRRPSFYLPAFVIFILLFLTMFGRSFAVLCTTIGWYLVPTIQGGSSYAKRPRKKKDYARRLSEKKEYVRRVSHKSIASD